MSWRSTFWANYRGELEWSVVQESAEGYDGSHHPRYAECRKYKKFPDSFIICFTFFFFLMKCQWQQYLVVENCHYILKEIFCRDYTLMFVLKLQRTLIMISRPNFGLKADIKFSHITRIKYWDRKSNYNIRSRIYKTERFWVSATKMSKYVFFITDFTKMVSFSAKDW